jgi:sphingosine kinase
LGSAILNVVRGRTKSCDLFSVESEAFKKRVGFLSLCYGIIADIDIESEKLRYMGEARFTVYALQRIASLRTYRAKLWYLPASDYSELVSHI